MMIRKISLSEQTIIIIMYYKKEVTACRKAGKMSTTQPIKSKEDLKAFMAYYKTTHPNPRNQALIILGLHTALRISDILELHWKDVYDFSMHIFKKHLTVLEQKTNKQKMVALNIHVIETLETFKNIRKPNPQDFIFSKRTDPASPISRSQAFRIVRNAARESLHAEHISCHSLRKTFGYHAWKQGISPVLLMDIYNHSSYQITKRYLGIDQDEKDHVYLDLKL